MNYTQANLPLFNERGEPILNQYQKARLWGIKFWQFSLFYGNYIGSLNSPNRSKQKNV